MCPQALPGALRFEETADQRIHERRFFVDHPVRAVGNALDAEIGHVAVEAVQVARQQVGIFLAPDDKSGAFTSSEGKFNFMREASSPAPAGGPIFAAR